MAQHQNATPPEKGNPDYVDYVVNLAKGGIMREGIINEPRAFYDVIPVQGDGAIATEGSPGVFVNGEQFPVRLTHLLASTTFLDQADPPNVDDPLNIQTLGLRMVFHDQFYMNREFLPVTVWGNKVVAAPDPISSSTSAWDFVKNGQPFVLSARDTLVVNIQLNDFVAPQAGVPVTVTFTGFGMLSKRPYLLTSREVLTDLNATDMSTVDFRNDGSEPIVVTDMTVNVASEQNAVNPRGDINRVSINIRQVGNGTNAQWFVGPTNPIAFPRMQATLCGVTTGRAVVHQFPGDGLIWEPGEGITVASRALDPAQGFDSSLTLALTGYIMVV